AGRPSSTAAPAMAVSASASSSSRLDANGPGREHVLERAQLRLGPDRDHDVADVDPEVGRRRDVERPVRLAHGNHDRSGHAADRELADRATRLGTVAVYLDLLEAQVRPCVRGDELEEGRDLRLERELRHLDTGGGIRPDDAVG